MGGVCLLSALTARRNQTLLEVNELTTEIKTVDGNVQVLKDVTLSIKKGEIVAIVGESGSGKSMTIHSILQLIPQELLSSYKGTIHAFGKQLLHLSQREMKAIRGKRVSLIAQNAMTSLDPSYTIGSQLVEVIRAKTSLLKKQARERARDLLYEMGIEDPNQVYHAYAHQLSGGQRQRAVIAMSLACEPDLIIADEPTSALDPTVQLQVLELLQKINREFGTAVLMITHDFGVVAKIADKVAVMYAGQVVEQGVVSDVMFQPKHPYTQGLLACIPTLDWIFDKDKTKSMLHQIAGEPPNLAIPQQGCRFAPRCSKAEKNCFEVEPSMDIDQNTAIPHEARCILIKEDK